MFFHFGTQGAAFILHLDVFFDGIRLQILKIAILCGIITKTLLITVKARLITEVWRFRMRIRYDKLWRKMKDNHMKKSELAQAAEISSYAMTKLNNDSPVTMEVMMNLCKVFHCDIGELMEVIEED